MLFTEPYMRFSRIWLFNQSLANALSCLLAVSFHNASKCIECFDKQKRLIADPFAPPAFTGFVTTMSQSDFWQTFGFSPFTVLKSTLPCFRSLSDLPGMQILLYALATLLDPDETYGILAYRLPYYCLRPHRKYRLSHNITNEAESLHAFALQLLHSTAYA